jgi:hypothetical protein
MAATTFYFLIFKGVLCAFCHFLFHELTSALFAKFSNKKKGCPVSEAAFLYFILII